jgi:hypothetical protein
MLGPVEAPHDSFLYWTEAQLAHHVGNQVRELGGCTPASGWEKGQVENQVGLVRERFFTPRLRFKTLDELNAWLLDKCIAYAKVHRHKRSSQPQHLSSAKLGKLARRKKQRARSAADMMLQVLKLFPNGAGLSGEITHTRTPIGQGRILAVVCLG